MKGIPHRIAAALLCALATTLAAPSVFAADPVEGQEQYKQYCNRCHADGSPHGEYTPMTLIQDQWSRFFDRKYERTHKDVIDEAHGGKPVTEAIPADVLESIRRFAIDHAADTENPMTCG